MNRLEDRRGRVTETRRGGEPEAAGDAAPAIFEPVHGSAPDVAGTGTANPAAMLRSLALMLEHSFARADLARAVDEAVERALSSTPTRDLGGVATTSEFGDMVLESLATVSVA